jgi:hypothetical protein
LLDAIPVAVCLPEGLVEQRGVSRPQGPACDIGAVELAVVAPVVPRFTS